MSGRTGRRPNSTHAVVPVREDRQSWSVFFKMRCSSFYCFSGAGSEPRCVAHIALFIWYEKFRRCVISPADPQRQISKRVLWVRFVTPELFSFDFSGATWAGLPVQDPGTSEDHRCGSIGTNQGVEPGPTAVVSPLFATSPSSSSAPT